MNTFGLNRPLYSFGLAIPGAFLIGTGSVAPDSGIYVVTDSHVVVLADPARICSPMVNRLCTVEMVPRVLVASANARMLVVPEAESGSEITVRETTVTMTLNHAQAATLNIEGLQKATDVPESPRHYAVPAKQRTHVASKTSRTIRIRPDDM